MSYLRTFLLTSVQMNLWWGLVLDVIDRKKARPQVMKELKLIKLITEGKI